MGALAAVLQGMIHVVCATVLVPLYRLVCHSLLAGPYSRLLLGYNAHIPIAVMHISVRMSHDELAPLC